MPRATCTVCLHPAKDEIDQALRAGIEPIRAIAGRTGLKKSALDRHKHHDEHSKLNKIGDQLDRVDAEIKRLKKAETLARKRRDNRTALGIAKELRYWFTLRERAEALAVAAQPQQDQGAMDHGAALDIARALIEQEISAGSHDVLTWLHGLAVRFPGTNSAEPEPLGNADEHGAET